MSFDLLGQLFGKTRRRDLEAQAAQAVKPLKIALPVIGSRLAAAGLTSIVDAALRGTIPHDAKSAAAVAAGALGAVILATPDAFQASGLLRSVSPDTASLAQKLAAGVKAITGAPAASREAQLRAAVAEEVRAYGPALVDLAAEAVLHKTRNFGPGDLAAPQAPTAAGGASDTAILQTGGNQ